MGCEPPPGPALRLSDRFPIDRRLSLASLYFGGLLPTAFAPVGLFLPHWLLALGSCGHGAPGFFGMLFSFSFNFVFGELKLYGLHTSRI